MAYENRNAAYDLSLFDDSSDYVPGSAAPERKEEVHKKQCFYKLLNAPDAFLYQFHKTHIFALFFDKTKKVSNL